MTHRAHLCVLSCLLAVVCRGDEPGVEKPAFDEVTVRGRVVWAADALARRFGVRAVPESRERLLCLETKDGQLHPLLEDPRGRAFRVDPRLRERDVELLTRRHRGSPLLQIVRVYELAPDGRRFELDYWCEICAIAMYELKPCDCCQGDIELRRTPR